MKRAVASAGKVTRRKSHGMQPGGDQVEEIRLSGY